MVLRLRGRTCAARWPEVRPNEVEDHSQMGDGVKLTFLGTRGEIKVRSRLHGRHSSLLVGHEDARIMIDCGTDWLGRLGVVGPTAIVLTHAHRDHAAGLAAGAPCPVYATEAAWSAIGCYPVCERRLMPLHQAVAIQGISFEAFPVEHSLRAPAVGYRISARSCRFFYVPDVAYLPDISRALHGIRLYIGDGASLTRSMVRQRPGALIGRASIMAQLGWCRDAHVHRAIFTHCGSGIVRGEAEAVNELLRQLGCRHGVEASIATDGERLCFPSRMAAEAETRRA
jgi:phosphoribosyl 1,2-cyclic phosphodiesterase